MSAATAGAVDEYGPWNPGIGSGLPRQLLPLSTIFRPENVFTSVAHAHELRDFTGLALEELVVFRPERLVTHELLIRITADFLVPSGSKVEDLGINFRHMANRIFTNHVAPRMAEIVAEYARIEKALADFIAAELSATFYAPANDAPSAPAASTVKARLLALSRRFRQKENRHPRVEDECEKEERILREWIAKSRSAADPLLRAAYRSLTRAVSAIRIRHGRMWAEKTLLASLATGLACNDYGSEALGRMIDPLVRKAAATEGYILLPPQERPVVLNTKGASASGKSTMRPLQKKLIEEIGIKWDEFALISPDIWRKYLLDYGSLGDAYKYAGVLAGVELEIIDHKLDRHMAQKAERGETTHLLIDRFRFDSFASDSDKAGSNLLTRFGYLIYMFFMITPPHATVERAWKRGLEVGRYKAVDDLLAHNVEAYTGMPELFFTWALRANKSVHYEFLDNSVPCGERPRTAAFGWNGEMNILDVKCMLDIDRYRKIDINATTPQAVYPGRQAMAAENNTQFLTQCVRRIPVVNFADRASGRIYARIESGRLAWADAAALDTAMQDRETRIGILAVAPETATGIRCYGPEPARLHEKLQAARIHTIGQWGGSVR
ncbi:MAG: hypothetical protein ACK4N4_02935 [Burkholderiales bacterium]